MNVSVVIPCFNAAAYLGTAIESVLAQTRPPAEIIVSDDGSTDDSVRIAESFGVTVVRGAHGGTSKARNAGIAAASGELIAWLDADDLWLPEKLERQVPEFSRREVGLVYGRHCRFRQLDALEEAWPPELPQGDVFVPLYYWCFMPNSSVVVRRSAILAEAGFDESLSSAVDWDMWLRIATRWQVVGVPSVVSLYRVHDQQLSAKKAQQIVNALRLQQKMRPELERRGGTRVDLREHFARYCVKRLKSLWHQRQLDQVKLLSRALREEFRDLEFVRNPAERMQRLARLPRTVFWVKDGIDAMTRRASRRVTR
jgi:glycosyltransferase involved in cell wall biosynthesis